MSFCSSIFVILAVFVTIVVGLGGETNDFITWKDLKVSYSLGSQFWGDDQSRVIVVDKNGSGDSVTVQGAIDLVPVNNTKRVKIHVHPGVYREKVEIPKSKPYISLIGNEDQATRTIITWHDKASDEIQQGRYLGTWNSASVTILSDYFCASDITFENSVIQQGDGVEGYQAVSLRIQGDKAVFYQVRFLGSQDTLLDETGSHFFFRCFIQGSTDFIFGNAKSLYKECNISAVGNSYALAAHRRNSAFEDTGFSFVDSTIFGTGEIYLGRAWGNYSRIVYSRCEINVLVRPGGWDDWKTPCKQKTVDFAEYECRGIGADRSRRAQWSKQLNFMEASSFLTTKFINGDTWLRL